VSIDDQPRTDRGLSDEFTSSLPREPGPDQEYWIAEQWLDLYLKEGLRIIPLCGANDLGVFNPKKPGYPQWQKYIPSRDELLSALAQGKMWGCVCGSVSRNLQIVDYDLYKTLGSNEKALEWRKENIPFLRSLKTLVTFTPRGGLHVWIRTKEPGLQTSVVTQFTRTIPLKMDLIRSEGGQVVIPPSKLEGCRQLLVYGRLQDSTKRKTGNTGHLTMSTFGPSD